MTCSYNFLFDGKELEGYSLPTRVPEDTITGLIRALSEEPEIAKELVDKIEELQNQQQKLITPLNASDKVAALHKISKKLIKLGIPVTIGDNSLIMALGIFPEGTKAAVHNGGIYINTTLADITSPMHEFLHIVFAVMKTDDFDLYNVLMDKISKSKDFKSIKDNLPIEYSSMSELDRQEEATARLFEKILETESIELNTFGEHYDDINNILSTYISKTFNINLIVDTLDFLRSPLSDLPRKGSTLFIRRDNKLGYFLNLKKVKLQEKISNLIDILSTEGVIDENGNVQKIERDCK